MLERTGISIERQCSEPESFPRGSPARNRHEYLAEDLFRLESVETKARRRGQRTCGVSVVLMLHYPSRLTGEVTVL